MKPIKYTSNRNYRDFYIEESDNIKKPVFLNKKRPNILKRIKKAVDYIIKG
jgi:hypothetical protein